MLTVVPAVFEDIQAKKAVTSSGWEAKGKGENMGMAKLL
jgi:hypothetical protein